MSTRILRDDRDLAHYIAFLRAQPVPMTVSHVKGANRSKQQNATLHMWFGQIAAQTYTTADDVKGQCKLRHGLPIMEAERPEWVEQWRPLYGPLRERYTLLVRLFSALPMTSVMTTAQAGRFMDAVQIEYREQGVYLTDPEARKYEAEFSK